MSRQLNSNMTLARYRVICRQLHKTDSMLRGSWDAVEWAAVERIAAALADLARIPAALRVQVCQQCRLSGYYEAVDDPFTGLSCDHPAVPIFDVSTGRESYLERS